MSQFVQRIANYVANELVIKGLANSKTFQRFAVRTNQQYSEFTEKGTKQMEEVLGEALKKTATTAEGTKSASGGRPVPPRTGVPGFFAAFAKEVRKDVTGQ